jgi:hypothetical protein
LLWLTLGSWAARTARSTVRFFITAESIIPNGSHVN